MDTNKLRDLKYDSQTSTDDFVVCMNDENHHMDFPSSGLSTSLSNPGGSTPPVRKVFIDTSSKGKVVVKTSRGNTATPSKEAAIGAKNTNVFDSGKEEIEDLLLTNNNLDRSLPMYENNINPVRNNTTAPVKDIKVVRASDRKCRICSQYGHIAKACLYRNKTRKHLHISPEKHKNDYRYKEQEQKPKVSMDGTGERDPEFPIPKPTKVKVIINYANEWANQIPFDYVDENHTLPFGKKVELWINKEPNIQHDVLPKSILKFCQRKLGFSRGNIHFNSYVTNVFESKLYRGWVEYFIDINMFFLMKGLKEAIIHFFFHDMKTLEKYYPLFKANEGYSASINNARPILDSRTAFTAVHSLFLNIMSPLRFLAIILVMFFALLMGNIATKIVHYTLTAQFYGLLAYLIDNSKLIATLVSLIISLKLFISWKRKDEPTLLNQQYDVPIFTLCQTYPMLSIIIEEIVKCFPYGWALIGFLEYLKYGTWDNMAWHKNSMMFKFLPRISHHIETNKSRMDSTIGKPGSVLYALNMQCEKSSIEIPTFVEQYQINEVIELLPSRIPKLGENMKIYTNLKLFEEKGQFYAGHMHKPKKQMDHHTYRGYFPILFNVSTMRKPAPSFDNLLGACHYRASDIPNSVYRENKNTMDRITAHLVHYSAVMNVNTRLEWYKGLKTLQQLRIQRVQKAKELGFAEESIQVSVKSDELISTREKMVPRLIFNVSGYWLDKLGETAKQLSNIYSEVWDYKHSHPIKYKKQLYYIYFTCGATSTRLNKFYQDALTLEAYSLLVLGDDLLVYDGYNKRLIENDFSKFDRSQNYDVQDMFLSWLSYINHEDMAVDLERMLHSTSKPRCRKINPIKIDFPDDIEMMPTGQPFTCLQNSVINILSTIRVLSTCFDGDEDETDIAIKYGKFGLSAKVQLPKLNAGTFLKGVFLDGVWTRLPSFLCKFGKIMTHPDEISRSGNRLAQFLYAQWRGYGNIANNWFYRAFGSIVIDLCIKNGLKEEPEEKINKYIAKEIGDYTLISESSWVSNETFNNFMYNRYGFTVDMMDNLLSSYRSISYLPTILHVPSILLLEERDY